LNALLGPTDNETETGLDELFSRPAIEPEPQHADMMDDSDDAVDNESMNEDSNAEDSYEAPSPEI